LIVSSKHHQGLLDGWGVLAMRSDERTGMKIDFGDVVDALPGLVWTTQADCRSDFVNRRWREYTGLSLDEATGLGWQTAIHPDDRSTVAQCWELIHQSGSAGEPSGIAREMDARLRRFDGQYRWFVLRLSPLPEDGSRHQRWCWLGVNSDEGPETDGRLRRLFDMLPIRAGFLDAAGVLQFANREAREKILGSTLEELRDWQTSGAMLLEDYARNRSKLGALLTRGEMLDDEVRMRHKDGVYRWARARAVAIRDAEGNAVRYLSCQIDIDDLKRAEALLAAEVKLLEMVARGEPLGQVLEALSRHVEELCSGCVCSVLVVAQDRKHLHVEAGPNLLKAFYNGVDGNAVVSDPCSLAVIEKVPINSVDLSSDPRWEGSPWLSAMNNLGFVSCCAMPVLSASGAVSGVVAAYRSSRVSQALQEEHVIDRFTKIGGIAIDRAEADAALQARDRELREALAQLSEGQRLSKTGSFTSDIQQDRHRWSDELYRIFEIDRSAPPRLEAVRNRIHPDDLPLFDAEMLRRIEGRSADFTFRVVTPEGEVKHLRGVSQIIEHVAGRPIFMGTIQDLTESKLAEETLNRTRSELAHVARVATLNVMTASIAHEVSQPLSGILTNAGTCVRMLAGDPPNLAGAAETARRTVRDANRATEVIERLRAMFSTKAPAMELADLNEVAREVIALSMGELRRAGALLQTDFADDLPRISVDRVQLQQVILNLLLNAADAMAGVEDRPRRLLVKTRLYDDGNVELVVRDSGMGIASDKVERLFDAFYTTKPKGMGVGLSISRSIIARHEGRLWAETNEGPGATFSFCIPGASVRAV
jgi:PAS domain S-box-containing protein